MAYNYNIIKLRRGTAAEWQAANELLKLGEPGFEKDTYKLKIGDGETLWNDLPYVSGGMGGDNGPLNYDYGDGLLTINDPPTQLLFNSLSNNVDYSDYLNFLKDNKYNALLKLTDSSGNINLLSASNIISLGQTLTNVNAKWPSNSINYIDDGGSDQYDDGNYINSNFTFEGIPSSSDNFANLDSSSLLYNSGNVGTSAVVGNNSYVTLYKKSLFAMVVKGSTNMPSMITFSGYTGSDGDGNKDVDSLNDYNGYQAAYCRLWGDDPTYTKLIITKIGTIPSYFQDESTDTDDDLFGASGINSDTIAMVVLYGSDYQSPVEVSNLQTVFQSFVDNVLVGANDCDTVKNNFYNNFDSIYTSVFNNFWYDNFQFFVGSGKKISNIATTGGDGTGLTIDLSVNNESQKYILTINNAGYNYEINDTITLPGDNIIEDYYDENTVEGNSPEDDIVFTVVSVDEHGSVTSLSFDNITSSEYFTSDVIQLQKDPDFSLDSGSSYYLNIDIIGSDPNDFSDSDLRVCSLELTGNPYYAGDPVVIYQQDSTQQNKIYDKIDTGLTLARGTASSDGGGGLYNSEEQNGYNDNGDNGPSGTEWNADGWDHLSNITSRSYTSLYDVLNQAIGTNITNAELVMHDTQNDKYYKFDFSWWQPGAGNNYTNYPIGGFRYTRTLLWVNQESFTFVRGNNQPNTVDEIDTGLIIKRVNNGAIFNSVNESGWDPDISPKGTLWNIEGWDDLTNVSTREYNSFYSATGGQIGNNILHRDYVMFDTINKKYYKVKFTNWGGNGGAFTYTRQQINGHCSGGVKFNDGTIQNTAYSLSSVSGIASGVVDNAFNTSLIAGSGISLYYDSGSDTLTISSSGTGTGANTGDITFSGSTISTLNTDQNITIITSGSGDVIIGTDSNNNHWIFGTDGGLTLPGGSAQVVVEDDGGVRIGTAPLNTSPNSQIKIGGADHAFEVFGGPPGYSWKFDANGELTLPSGSILSETSNTLSLAPPTADAGQSLVIRPTIATWAISSSNYIEYGNPITISVTLQAWAYFGTVNYTISGTGVTPQSLGRALTGKLTFVSTTGPDTETITWTIPANSNITEFTLTLTSVDGTRPGPDVADANLYPELYYNFEENGMPTGQFITVTNNNISNSEHSHIHLVAGDPSTVDIYLGDDDQYVKIEKNGGDVVIGTDSNSNHWIFDTSGNLRTPTNSIISKGYPGLTQDGSSWFVSPSGSTGGLASTDGEQYIQIGDNSEIYIGLGWPDNLVEWIFNRNGTLTLPTGGGITFPDATFQNTAWTGLEDFTNNLLVEGTGVQLTYNSGNNTLTIDNLHTQINELSKEPQGFVNRADSVVSFNDSTRTFTIQPTGSSYSIYIEGVKVTKTTTETVVIGTGTALNYVHFDTSTGLLSNKTTPFDFDTDVPIAYIHWNGDINQSTFFGEERHGIRMDSSTHKWIHNTFGMQYINGLSIGNYVLLGNGGSNSHAQISISDGTLYQEDIIINITDGSNGNPFTQDLSPIAYIPTYYHSGSTGQWVRGSGTAFPVKYNGTRAQYNLFSGGTWTTPNVTNNDFFAMWIVATNDINDPILAIVGQRQDGTLNSAENNNIWSDLNLANIPASEIKPLYRLIFRTNNSYTNTPKSSLQSILDLRVSVSATINGVTQNDHGLLFGLGDDDHFQYLHINTARTVEANHTFTNGLTISSGLLSATSGNFTSSLQLNGTNVSVSGHTHTSSDITNFNSAVSGLLPTIANSGDNRILTSAGTATGINGESNATFDGTNFNVTGVFNLDNLRLDGNTISSTNSNGNIVLAPSGTGDVQVDADTLRVGDSNSAATITTNGTGNLTVNTNGGTNSGSIVINQGSNGNIAITPNGTGEVDLSKVDIDGGSIDNTAIGATTASTGKFTQLYPTVISNGSVNGSVATDVSTGQIFDMTLTGATTLSNPTNAVNGVTVRWRITQDGSGGHSVTLDSDFQIPSSASSPLPWSTAANATDILAATYHAGRSKWDVVAFVPGY